MVQAEWGTGGAGVRPMWASASATALLDGIADAVIVADEESRIVYANRATEHLVGWDRRLLQGTELVQLIPERLRHAHLSGYYRLVAGGEPTLLGRPVEVPVLRIDGSEITVEMVLSVMPLEGGRRVVVASLRDVRERTAIERHGLVAEELLLLLARGLSGDDALGQMLAAIGETLGWDVAALWSVESDDMLRCRRVWRSDPDGFAHFEAACLGARLGRGEELPGRVLAYGKPAWVVHLGPDRSVTRTSAALADGLRCAFAFPLHAGEDLTAVVELLTGEPLQPDSPLVETMAAIGGQLGSYLRKLEAEQERERLAVELEKAQRLQAFLLRANRVLAESADYRETLERLAATAVPLLGDVCLIDVLDERDTLQRLAARHADSGSQALLDELAHDFVPDTEGRHPSLVAVHTGASSWSPILSEEFLDAVAPGERQRELVEKLGLRAYACVPLVVRGRTLGAVTLLTAGRPFGAEDLELADELAGQVAAVVDKARLHEGEHQLAQVLQQGLLPQRLPRVNGMAMTARYLPATSADEAGGDWYDVVALPDGKVGLAVGDVQGHDGAAALVMGQLRNALRAYAFDGSGPDDVLDRLSRFADGLGLELMATVAYVVLDPETGAFVAASAGHLAPLVVPAHAVPAVLDVTPGPPIGLGATDYAAQRGTLRRGDALVLFTDGLVEDRTTDMAEGLAALREALAKGSRDPAALAARLEERVLGASGREDDVAFLVARRLPAEKR
ncbi:MAG TPA: SpoIIE family protein phosphatase [Acidimicrobiales bacterium]|nr:SpoIIE family protein phosphatase [Acidimicrobiales bacterium]